jgi:hypothetical protein
MTTSPVLPIRQRSTHRFQKALGADLTRLYSAALAAPPPEAFLRLLAEADRLALPKAPQSPPSTTPRSKLSLFG